MEHTGDAMLSEFIGRAGRDEGEHTSLDLVRGTPLEMPQDIGDATREGAHAATPRSAGTRRTDSSDAARRSVSRSSGDHRPRPNA